MTPNVPIIAWAPDADPTTPGVMVQAENLLPTLRGYAPDFSAIAAIGFTSAMPEAPLSAKRLEITSASSLIFTLAGTSTRLYYLLYGGAPVDRSNGGGPYVATTYADPWQFDTISGVVLASNVFNPVQVTTDLPAVNFGPISGAPAARTICVQRNFVVAGGFNSGTAAWPYADGWWCSEQEDYTGWTPDIATQCARGRLTATPGAIVRMIAFQDSILAFKEGSLYRGTYTGPTANTWSWPVLSSAVGIVGTQAVTQAGSVLYWMAPDGVYRYAGGGIERIQSAPWNWLLDQVAGSTGLQYTQAQWDPVRRVVRFYVMLFGANGDGVGIAYHPETDRWGSFELTGGVTVDVPLQVVPTVTDGPYGVAPRAAPGFFGLDDRVLKIYAGTPAESAFTTGDIGDDDAVVALTRARVRFFRAPATSMLTHSHRMTLDDALTAGETSSRVDGKYDMSHSARWHRVRFDMTGAYEVSGFSVGPASAGKR